MSTKRFCFRIAALLVFVSWTVCATYDKTKTLPRCSLYNDTYGEWIFNPALPPTEDAAKLSELERHFLGSIGPGEALHHPFNIVWRTDSCAYHRFTNVTSLKCVNHMLDSKKMHDTKALRILFVGDSATRGVFCGMTRIFAGSEVYGPCVNEVCGGTEAHKGAVSYQEIGIPFTTVFFEGRLEITYIYTKSWNHWYKMAWVMADLMNGSPPDFVIANTGVWDFDDVARKHRGEDAQDYCENEVMKEIARTRASPEVNKTLWDLSDIAKRQNVTLIYRNNHYNNRYGPHCADDLVEELMVGSAWEVWDNKRISQKVWKEQTWDGFHFERIYMNTIEQHKALADTGTFYNIYGYWMTWPHAGALEIQLAQSLLQRIFHSCLEEKFPNE